jgi:hypothetical protein
MKQVLNEGIQARRVHLNDYTNQLKILRILIESKNEHNIVFSEIRTCPYSNFNPFL